MKIAIYSTATCPYCHMLKEWLNEKNIEYKNIMVDENQKGAEK